MRKLILSIGASALAFAMPVAAATPAAKAPVTKAAASRVPTAKMTQASARTTTRSTALTTTHANRASAQGAVHQEIAQLQSSINKAAAKKQLSRTEQRELKTKLSELRRTDARLSKGGLTSAEVSQLNDMAAGIRSQLQSDAGASASAHASVATKHKKG